MLHVDVREGSSTESILEITDNLMYENTLCSTTITLRIHSFFNILHTFFDYLKIGSYCLNNILELKCN